MQSEGKGGLLQWHHWRCRPSQQLNHSDPTKRAGLGLPKHLGTQIMLRVDSGWRNSMILVPECLRAAWSRTVWHFSSSAWSLPQPPLHHSDMQSILTSLQATRSFYSPSPRAPHPPTTTIFEPPSANDMEWLASMTLWMLCMHDNATHNRNAAHDDADINNDSDVDDVEHFFLFYLPQLYKAWGLFFLVNRE